MKTKILLIAVALILTTFYSFSENTDNSTEHEANKVNHKVFDDCDLAERVPRNLEELSIMTSLTLNLNDNCNFQPIHYQVRSGYPSTEIIARVFGQKTASGDFALSKMELKHFEVSNSPENIVVDTAYFSGEHNGKRIIKLKLMNLNENNCGRCEAKKIKLQKTNIDFVIENESPIILDQTTVLDVEILNELDLYPLFGLTKYDEASRPLGRHCNTNIVYY